MASVAENGPPDRFLCATECHILATIILKGRPNWVTLRLPVVSLGHIGCVRLEESAFWPNSEEYGSVHGRPFNQR